MIFRKPGIAWPTCCPALGSGLPKMQLEQISKWIGQEHIGDFGGEPSLVTLGGISAGAASTHYLMLSKVVVILDYVKPNGDVYF